MLVWLKQDKYLHCYKNETEIYASVKLDKTYSSDLFI